MQNNSRIVRVFVLDLPELCIFQGPREASFLDYTISFVLVNISRSSVSGGEWGLLFEVCGFVAQLAREN